NQNETTSDDSIWKDQNESTSDDSIWKENNDNNKQNESCGSSCSILTDGYNENESWKNTHIFSSSFDNLMFIILLCIFLPMFIRIILFFILLIIDQKDKRIETRKQLHIFYDYELYLEFIRKYDYKLFRYHDPIFGL